jgi:hypothetical protein
MKGCAAAFLTDGYISPMFFMQCVSGPRHTTQSSKSNADSKSLPAVVVAQQASKPASKQTSHQQQQRRTNAYWLALQPLVPFATHISESF